MDGDSLAVELRAMGVDIRRISEGTFLFVDREQLQQHAKRLIVIARDLEPALHITRPLPSGHQL